MARNSHACTIQEEHRCGWHCTTEHVIGNMYRCLSSGNVHICDANCNQRMDYGTFFFEIGRENDGKK